MNVPKLGILILVLGMTGCAAKLVRPEVITIDRPAYVRLPPSLLAPCVVPEFRVETNGDLAEAIVVIRGALITCAGQIDGVRKMQP